MGVAPAGGTPAHLPGRGPRLGSKQDGCMLPQAHGGQRLKLRRPTHLTTAVSSGNVPESTTAAPRVADTLRDQGHAGTGRGTSLIGVTADARTPEAAAAIANAVAKALVAQDAQQIDQLLKPTRDYLDSELK